jgi:hypothetical protein
VHSASRRAAAKAAAASRPSCPSCADDGRPSPDFLQDSEGTDLLPSGPAAGGGGGHRIQRRNSISAANIPSTWSALRDGAAPCLFVPPVNAGGGGDAAALGDHVAEASARRAGRRASWIAGAGAGAW